MNEQPPKESADIITTDCDKIILGIRRTILKISPHCWKRNKEFQASKKAKIRDNLKRWLLDKEVIKDFVHQIVDHSVRKEGINSEWPAWKYYGYEPVIDKRNDMAYRIIFFLDDNKPEIIGVITIYPADDN